MCLGINMFDGVVVGNKINAVIEAKPEVTIPVCKHLVYVARLKSFFLRKLVYQFALAVDDETAVEPGGQRHLVAIHNAGAKQQFVGDTTK